MTPKQIDTRATKEPGDRARPLLRFLAIGMLVLGIFGMAPIAMASDITTDTGFMAPAISGGIHSGGPSLQDIVAPETGCRDHVASCFHDQYYEGWVWSGCSLGWDLQCGDSTRHMIDNCRDWYGDYVNYAKSGTPCYYW